MEYQQKKFLLISILVLLIIVPLLFISQYYFEKSLNRDVSQPVPISSLNKETVTQEKKINDLKDKKVSFCGKEYKTNGAIIDGIDILEKISPIVAKDSKEHICENITSNNSGSDILLVTVRQSSPSDTDYNATVYYIQVGSVLFKIDTSSKKVYVLGGFDGEPAYIGTY